MPMRDLFSRLGLDGGATAEDVRRAYRRLALRCHPDLHVGDRAAHQRFVRLSRAYRALMDYLSHADGGRFGVCSACAATARLYHWIDGRDCCGECLLHGGRRLLPHPAIRLMRFYGVMALWLAAAAMLLTGALTAAAAWHAGAIGCTLLGAAWLAIATIWIDSVYDPTMPTSVTANHRRPGRSLRRRGVDERVARRRRAAA